MLICASVYCESHVNFLYTLEKICRKCVIYLNTEKQWYCNHVFDILVLEHFPFGISHFSNLTISFDFDQLNAYAH